MKPLKILLGNNTLSLLAGSETWTYTLALQLKEMGHSVTCYATELGVIAKRLNDAGIACYDQLNVGEIQPYSPILQEVVDHNYDVIISNHSNVVEFLRMLFPKTPIISTIHGVLHFIEKETDAEGKPLRAPEHPALESGVNQFVAVSEEVQEKLKLDYNIDSTIIRNFFDIKKFGALKPPSEKPKQFFINTNYAGREDEMVKAVKAAADHFGAKMAAVGINFTQTFDITRAIEDSDVVFGMGRSVLEGVAAGRLGIVAGRWGLGGPILPLTVDELRKVNFSGRGSNENPVTFADEIIKMVTEFYNPTSLAWSKEYIAKEHNVVHAAEAYVRLARELTGEAFSRPKGIPSGVDPVARPFRLAQ